MTLRDMQNAGIEIQGWVTIQCIRDDDTVILYDGHGLCYDDKILDREVKYIFPNMFPIGYNRFNEQPIYSAKLVIEIEEELK